MPIVDQNRSCEEAFDSESRQIDILNHLRTQKNPCELLVPVDSSPEIHEKTNQLKTPSSSAELAFRTFDRVIDE